MIGRSISQVSAWAEGVSQKRLTMRRLKSRRKEMGACRGYGKYLDCRDPTDVVKLA
jgi:vacuolar-type H+-ATPase catalytic subunit A/Vma1